MDFKKVIVAFCSSILVFFAHGQIQFNRIYNGSSYDRGEGLIQFADSSYLVTGTSSSFADAPTQAFLMKLDKFGYVQWSKAYGGTESESGRRVIHRPGIGFYLFGSSNSGTSGDFDIYVVHTDLNGDVIWEKRFDGGGWERIHDAFMLPDTSFVIAAETNNNVEQLADRFLLRMDKDGTIIWQKHISGQGEEIFRAVTPVSDTTFFAVGSGYNVDSSRVKGYISLYHMDGTKLWDTLVGNNGEYRINEVHPYGTQWIFTGHSSIIADDYDPFYLRLNGDLSFAISDDNHNITYSESYDQFVNFSANTGQLFFVASSVINSAFTYPNGADAIINLFVSQFYWGGYAVNYGTIGEDGINEMIPTNDGYACAVGFHEDQNTGGGNCFVVKIGQEFSFPSAAIPTPLSILAVNEPVSNELDIFPNPMNDKLFLQVKEGQVEQVVLYTSTGQPVLQAKQVSSIDVSQLPAGMYVLEVTTNRGKAIRKVVK